MKAGEDYEFQDSIKTDTVPLKLLTGPYADVIFKFNSVSVKESSEKTHATISFSYDILKTPLISETTLRRDKKFETHIGLILNSLIIDSADATISQEKLKGNNGTSRKSDITELISE